MRAYGGYDCVAGSGVIGRCCYHTDNGSGCHFER
jgi:hypothetical protein